MITKLSIVNYRLFESFTFECNPGLNIIVGDNESGKSTILEAINLALTGRLNGRAVEAELSPHLFNEECKKRYVSAIKDGANPEPPKILIELYLVARAELQLHSGSNNQDHADCCGVMLEIAFDEECRGEYLKLLETRERITDIPIEYYKVSRRSFAGNSVTHRNLSAKVSYIDATTIRLHSGTDYYLQSIISGGLDERQRSGLAFAYRELKVQFAAQDAIQAINREIEVRGKEMTSRALALGIDLSPKGAWELNLVPHLDGIPLPFVGKGEQSGLKIMLALDRSRGESDVILVEEPENHLSFSTMSVLIDRISAKCKGKQIFATTHSAYVLNRLGIDSVVLLRNRRTAFLTELSSDTRDYFRKLPGYDTLRMILAKKTILVEGPSDELVVQRAYLQLHGRLPIEAGIDVISVRGLSFARFLDIARLLSVPTTVVTDNDGDYAGNVIEKYAPYSDCPNIAICASEDVNLPTLENHIVAENDRDHLNRLFGRSYAAGEDLVAFMKSNKTEWALKVFDSDHEVAFPEYVHRALH